MRIIRSALLLLIAAALVTGCFYYLDSGFDGKDVQAEDITVTSELTHRIYALEDAMTAEKQAELDIYEAELDKEIAAYLKQHGGGGYTDSSGSYHYVPSSSGGGGYSDGGGYSGGGGSSGGGGYGGYWVPAEEDETEWNYCQDCGTWYTGGGDCPNPDCPGRHPQ